MSLQTGTGKTHTMIGTEEEPGIIPLVRISTSFHAKTQNYTFSHGVSLNKALWRAPKTIAGARVAPSMEVV